MNIYELAQQAKMAGTCNVGVARNGKFLMCTFSKGHGVVNGLCHSWDTREWCQFGACRSGEAPCSRHGVNDGWDIGAAAHPDQERKLMPGWTKLRTPGVATDGEPWRCTTPVHIGSIPYIPAELEGRGFPSGVCAACAPASGVFVEFTPPILDECVNWTPTAEDKRQVRVLMDKVQRTLPETNGRCEQCKGPLPAGTPERMMFDGKYYRFCAYQCADSFNCQRNQAYLGARCSTECWRAGQHIEAKPTRAKDKWKPPVEGRAPFSTACVLEMSKVAKEPDIDRGPLARSVVEHAFAHLRPRWRTERYRAP